MQQSTIKLTQGNINSNHFYLRGDVRALFPDDVFGGRNTAQKGHEVEIDWGGKAPAFSDISTHHMIFRRRGWVKEFFLQYGLAAGDLIGVQKLSDYRYRVFPITRDASPNAS